MATERDPLVVNNEPNHISNGNRESRNGIIEEFENGIREEDPETTLFDLLTKRPTTVIVALSLFALIVLITSSIASFNTSEFVESLLDVPEFSVTNLQLAAIENREIVVNVQTEYSLNYERFNRDPNSYIVRAFETLSMKLGSVKVEVDGLLTISMTESGNSAPSSSSSSSSSSPVPREWLYLISCDVRDPLNISILPYDQQSLDLNVHFTDVGRSDSIETTMRHILQNEPIIVRTEGTAVISKFGISLRFPFTVERPILIPKQTTSELAELSRVAVDYNKQGGLEITALANASVVSFPIAADFPALAGQVKIPGCDAEKDIEYACDGTVLPFELRGEDGELNINFRATINKIPEKLVSPCVAARQAARQAGNTASANLMKAAKSPLDLFVSRYLNGESTTFYVEGQRSDKQLPIVNDLISGVTVPYTVFGKDPTEKLVQSVVLEEVQLSNSFEYGPPSISTDKGRFSGKVLVDVVLPKFLEMHAKTALMVKGMRGTIQLFTSSKEHFAQVFTWDDQKDEDKQSWLQTVTLASETGYKVTAFFDNLPVEITDRKAFSEVSQEFVTKGHALVNYDAIMDVQFESPIGDFVMTKIRIKGVTDMRAK